MNISNAVIHASPCCQPGARAQDWWRKTASATKTLHKVPKQCKWTITGTKNASLIPLSVFFKVLSFGPEAN